MRHYSSRFIGVMAVAAVMILGGGAAHATQYGVGSYSPSSSATCEAASFSHPAVDKPGFGVADLTVNVNGGEQAAYVPGSLVTVPFDGATVVEFRVFADYPGMNFKHQFGVTKVFQGECAAPEPEPTEEPVEPTPEPTEEPVIEPTEEPTEEPVGQPTPPVEAVEEPAVPVTPVVYDDAPTTHAILAETGTDAMSPWLVGGALALMGGGILAFFRGRMKRANS